MGRATDDIPSGYFGLTLLEKLRREFPGLPVIILSSKDRRAVSLDLDKLGSGGFLPREQADRQKLQEYLLEVFLNGEGPIVRKVIVRDIPLPFISSGNELAELVGQRVYKVHALGSSTSITEYKVCSSPAAYRLTYGGMYVHAMFQSLTVNGRDTNYGPYKESLQDMNVLPNSYNRHAIFALAQAAWIYANYVKDYPYYDFHQEINYS